MKAKRVNGLTFLSLSRKNLESLLAKLDGNPPGSACTISGGSDAPGFFVTAEENEIHYAHRPAGQMHEATELAIQERT